MGEENDRLLMLQFAAGEIPAVKIVADGQELPGRDATAGAPVETKLNESVGTTTEPLTDNVVCNRTVSTVNVSVHHCFEGKGVRSGVVSLAEPV